MTRRLLLLLLPALAWLAAGCGGRPAPAPSAPPPALEEDLASGRLRLRLKAEPVPVRLDRPLILTLTLSTPDTIAAEWPALEDRFEGFEPAGAYESGSRREDGRLIRELRVRLTPKPASEYRLKPMAVAYRETNAPTAPPAWIRTRPLVFPSEPLAAAAGLAPAADPAPVRRPPGEIALILLVAVAALALLAGAVWGVRRLLRARRLRQMSPRDRALLELADLAARRLVEEGRIKEFYFEVTGVVRRYIERRHGIRAPEQTTEEFLASAGADPRFPRESLRRLQEFLTAADFVKFADYRPGPGAGEGALSTARDYVTTDPAAPGEGGKA